MKRIFSYILCEALVLGVFSGCFKVSEKVPAAFCEGFGQADIAPMKK